MPWQLRIVALCFLALGALAPGAWAQGRGRGGAPAAVALGNIGNSDFKVEYDSQGIMGLSSPTDPFGAQLLTRGSHLGMVGRYRVGQGNWTAIPGGESALTTDASKSTLVYTSGGNGPVKLTQTFTMDGPTFDWALQVENLGTDPVEIGDLAMLVPAAGPGGGETGDPKLIFEHGFCRHQFIEGAGSFIYFVRASGVGPYLIAACKPGTPLEYFGNIAGGAGGRGAGGGGGGAGGAGATFIHSKATASAEQRGTWRLPNTSLMLAAAGAPDAKKTYGFRMQWAKTYDDMRDFLYHQGALDIRVVPGMTLPQDLTAKFSLHTNARIEAVDAEFPAQSVVKSLGEPQTGYHLYEVQFKKLGENLLTVRHDGGQKTYLEFFSTEPLETLIKKRSSFIAFHQQWRDPNKWFDGLFSVYDMKNKILRSPEDTDGWVGRNEYILSCDDTALGKAPYVASKNVHFPVREEIESVEYYLQHFVWGGLQRTDKESPYPYGVYGIPNWHVQRDPELKRNFEVNANNRPDLAEKLRCFRSYDYPHIVMLYFHMYEIAKKYPEMVKYLDAKGYLERAYQTARAYFTYPIDLLPGYYETYKWGCYNELLIPQLIGILEQDGQKDKAAFLRSEWEKKVKYFVYDDPYPFRSEFAFDRTAFESSYALAKYGATSDMKPDEKLWRDPKVWFDSKGTQEKWYSHPSVKKEDSRAFMDRQYWAGMSVRGWLENAYYLLGADARGGSGSMSYMAQMGGWGILDYGISFADNPADSLQLGYASYLSAWSLMNTGTPDTNYGFWFPGKENDGATGWTFLNAKTGRGWDAKDEVRGPWHYDGEIDLGYGGALRMASTVLTRDPVFGWFSYGGKLTEANTALSVVPRDGLRQRFYAVIDDPRPSNGAKPKPYRLKLELDRDGFAAEDSIVTDTTLRRVAFNIENRTGDDHTTGLLLSAPESVSYSVRVNGQKVNLVKTGDWDYPWRADIKMTRGPAKVEVVQ